MPKRQPDQVITHRIELGEWERQNLGRPVAESTQVSSVLQSLGVAGFGTAAIFATYALWKLWGVFDFAKEKLEVVADQFDNATDPEETNGGSIYGVGPLKGISQWRRIFSL